MGVDVGAAATAEGRKRDPALSCKFDGERRRCGDGEDDLDAAHGRLLNHFVGGSGADDKRAVTPAPAGTKTEQLVKRDMPADVFDAARNGDALAAREVDEMTDTLGMALATIAATTDPEMFLVGGGVSRAGDVLFDPLVEHYKTYAFKSCRETPIKAASLGNDAGIYGAVRLIVGD